MCTSASPYCMDVGYVRPLKHLVPHPPSLTCPALCRTNSKVHHRTKVLQHGLTKLLRFLLQPKRSSTSSTPCDCLRYPPHMFLSFLPLVLILLTIFYFVSQKRAQRPPPGLKSAPGPSGALPIIGNAHQLTAQPHRQIQKWAREYGEVYKARIGWYDWYMLCSPQAVKEIMDRQSVHTSSRAPMPAANDGLSGGMRFLFMGYGPEWRKLRGISHKLLTPAVSATFKPSQEWEGKMLLEEVLKAADESKLGDERGYRAVRRYTVSVIMTSTYGRRIPEWVRIRLIPSLTFWSIVKRKRYEHI